ncbi:MAG: hypothetical protein DCC71_01005 [Proteobacteria bacterium]|nr:MAG: hypothetical protein DCC71_01005 [Pseudomonadota bacterium]
MAGASRRYLGRRARALGAPRSALPFLVFLVCWLAIAALGCGEKGPPHLFLITSDALRADHLSYNGYARETSPQLDRFAAAATSFAEAVTVIPKTGPSFTSMLSGLHPVQHGVEANYFAIPPEVSLVAERLAAAGYQTAAFIGNPVLEAANGYGRGFQRYIVYGAGDPVTLVNAAFFRWSREVDWSRPVFVWIHYIDPHGPYTPPAELLAPFADDALARGDTRRVPLDYEVMPGWPPDYTLGAIPRYQQIGIENRAAAYVARYDAEIRHMDRAFGEVIALLEERDVLDASAVLFTSDHGESLGEADYWFEHGWFVDEPCLRIPLLLKAPGQRRSERSNAPASVLDVAPTLLALAGLPPDPRGPGRDLRSAPPPEAPPLLVANASTYPSRYFGLRTPEWKYLRRTADSNTAGVPGEPPDEALYDLSVDRSDRHEITSRRPERVQALRGELEARLAARAETPKPLRAPIGEETERQLRALGYAE